MLLWERRRESLDVRGLVCLAENLKNEGRQIFITAKWYFKAAGGGVCRGFFWELAGAEVACGATWGFLERSRPGIPRPLFTLACSDGENSKGEGGVGAARQRFHAARVSGS